MSSLFHDVIVIQSKDRNLALGGYPSSNFKIQLPVKYAKVVQLQLLSVELPHTFYNITGAYTTGITFVGPIMGVTSARNFTLTTGNYSIDDFCDSLLAFLKVFTYSLVGVTTPYVTSVDYNKNNIINIITQFPLYSYNTSSTGKLALISGLNPDLTGLPASATTPEAPTSATTNTNNLLNADSTYSHYFNYPCNFNLDSEILLKFGNISANCYSSSKTQSTFHIQVNTPFGNTIFVNTASNTGNSYNTNNIALEFLDVTLTSLDNEVIDLNGHEWVFSIGITYQ